MPESTTDERGSIAFSRWGSGGWWTPYKGRTLRLVSEKDDNGRIINWLAYEVFDGPPRREEFRGEGRKRDLAAREAMDRIDAADPSEPLRTKEQAAWWIRTVRKAHPAAVDFYAVRDEAEKVIGWTFSVEEDEKERFGWVSVDRRQSEVLEDGPDQAERALTATVAAPKGEPSAVPVQAAAAPPAEAAGVIEGAPVERGTCPRYADARPVQAALEALGKYLPEYHPKRMRLAEVTDRFEIGERETYPAGAWGALVLPQERSTVDRRVYAYWMEGGEWDRPYDVAATVPLQAIAERLSRAGFSIEAIAGGRVSALYNAPPRREGTEPPVFSDVWSLTNRSGSEVAVIECGSDDALMDLARCLPHVRATIQNEGGVVRRRMSQWEIGQRRAADGDPLKVAVHHCGERGHAECGAGTRLTDLDPQGHGRIVPAPVRQVEAVDGGTVGERQLPTHVKGTLLLGVDGRRHKVWETVWREWDGKAVETVITAAGEEHRVDRLAELPGGVREVERGAHKGDAVAEWSSVQGRVPMAYLCPDGHGDLVAAVRALERFRSGPQEERGAAVAAAEEHALWAAAKLYYATGELTVGLWRVVVRCGVELYARRLRGGRSRAVEPQPERNSFFGAGRRSLEGRSPAGFREMLDAARHLVYSMHNPGGKADRAVEYAAYEFAEALGGEPGHWVRAVQYLAELLAVTIVHENAWRKAQAG